MDESSLKDALMFFLKEPCGDSCHTLVSETVSIVEKTIKDFQVTGKFDELIDQFWMITHEVYLDYIYLNRLTRGSSYLDHHQ